MKRKGAAGKLSDKVKIKSTGDSALAALFARFIVVESPDMLDGIIGELPPGAGAVAADGIIEEIEDPRHTFWVGVQFHPERMACNEATASAIFRAFLRAAGRGG